MYKCYLGLDYGTGGAKACIIDDQASVLSYAFREYPIINLYHGWSEHDPLQYWKITCELIKKCIKEAKIFARDIKCIGISSAMPCMVMIDKKGNPINNAYNLMDRRAIEQVEWIKNNIGERKIFEITGNRLEDHPSIINLMWEKKNRPDDFKKIHKALTIDSFIRYKLTGKNTIHYSGAWCYGVAYDIRNRLFKQEILEMIGIDKSLLPDLSACDDIIGEVSQQSAKESGLKSGTLVCGGQVDCNASWLGAGAIEPGDIQMNLGTCGNFGIIHKDTNFLDSMITFAYTINSEDTYITVPTTTTGGQSLRYIRDRYWYDEISLGKESNKNIYEIFDDMAEGINPGSEGLIILPFLMGERSPIWDINARGVVFGLTLLHGKAHIIRATMEGVAFALYDNFRIIKQSGKKINYPIVLNEGGAKSWIWRKIITDVFNYPTCLVKRREGAPFGDAVLAAVSEGGIKDYSITKEKTEYVDYLEPDKRNHDIYMDYFELFKRVYDSLKDSFLDLALVRKKH